MYCAPKYEKNKSKLTCYSKESLVKIAGSYNQHYANKIRNVNKKNRDELWYEIQNRLSDKCTNEACWAEQKFVGDRSIVNKTFRTKMPTSWKKNKYEWLSTPDIKNVMKQYEDADKSFYYMGTFPIDCPNGIFCELSNFDLKKMEKNGYNKIGMVFNLDKHDDPGSHWVAMYIDSKNIDYFDSYGSPPPKILIPFINSVKNKWKLKYHHNKKRFQYGGSECGLFSMYFLLHKMNGATMQEIEKKKITDRMMNQLRKYFYRN